MKYQEKKKQWYLDNRDQEITRSKQYREDNKEILKIKRRERKERKREQYRPKINADRAKRRASKLKATPKWANLEAIRVLYERATWLKSLTGLTYHVDHIIPLQGKNVCGLHVHANLQLLEASLNISKGNKYE